MEGCKLVKPAALASLILAALLAAPVQAKTLYFPHFGDGSGFSMIFVINNLSPQPVTGTLRFYGSDGSLQTLPFEEGERSEISLDLAPHSTAVFATRGTSQPVRSGYAVAELDEEQVTGSAIFRFGSHETTVLPAEAQLRAALFVERSSRVDTGVALFKPSEDPVVLTLFDENGREIVSRELTFRGHRAQFLSETFTDLNPEFTGTLVLRSRTPFVVTGLRLGNGVLSTVPVEEVKTVERILLDRLVGVWEFEFTILSSFTREYSLHEVFEAPAGAGEYWLAGVNRAFAPVLVVYDPGPKKLLLVELGGNASDRVFVFSPKSRTEIEGCYHSRDTSSGELSGCYPLSGRRKALTSTDWSSYRVVPGAAPRGRGGSTLALESREDEEDFREAWFQEGLTASTELQEAVDQIVAALRASF